MFDREQQRHTKGYGVAASNGLGMNFLYGDGSFSVEIANNSLL